MVETLDGHGKDSLSEVIRYSYLYSIDYDIESSILKQYSDCSEDATNEPSFCLDAFNWKGDFELWSSSEAKLVCGKVMTTLQTAAVSSRCAFIISNVFEAYSFYLNKLLDTMVNYEMQFLSTELEQALFEAEQNQLERETSYTQIGEWLNNITTMSEEKQY